MGTMSGGMTPDLNPSHLSSISDMRHHLQTLMNAKVNQLEQVATLGQQILAQRSELEQRIAQLQDALMDKEGEEEMDSEARQRYRELSDTLRSWDSENAKTSATFGGSSRIPNGSHPSPPPRPAELPKEEPERVKPVFTASQNRRAKNAAHRADDVEFAFEIGSGLLTEVRRLQSLLAERDKVIQDMKEEKDDLEKLLDTLRTSLRQQEQSTDKYKEENWNLEVTLQEIRSQLADLQASSSRAEGEIKRLTKQLASSQDIAEQQKTDLDRLQISYDELKAKHETDIAQARKHAAGLQRDKSDLQQAMEVLKAENIRAARRLPRLGGSPSTPTGIPNDFMTPGDNGDDDDMFSLASTNRRRGDNSLYVPDKFSDFVDASPEASPVRAPNHPSNEIEALQQRLAHAQRQISTLKNTLQREKELKMDYRRKLGNSPGIAMQDEEDEGDFEEEADETALLKSSRRPTPYRMRGNHHRGRGRGRGRGGLTISERLSMAASSPASEFNDDDQDEFEFGSSPPPLPAMPLDVQIHVDEEPEERARSPSPSPFDPPSNRTSIDGMDPAFANVLKRTPSTNSIPYTSSPLRQGLPTRGGPAGRRNRGGAAFQEARPPSLVGQPDVLAAELGFGTPLKGNTSVISEVAALDTAEIGCQTEPMEVEPAIAPPVPAPAVMVSTAECGVQSDAPEEPAPPVREVVESAVQTSSNSYSEMSVQSSPAVVSTVSIGMTTEEEPKPVTSQAGVQAQPASADVESQTTTLTQPQLVDAFVQGAPEAESAPDFSSSSLADVSLTPTRAAVFLPEDSDGDETETGMDTETETETDPDDYTDARQTTTNSTPFQSVDDFHSFRDEAAQSIMQSTPSQSMDDFHSMSSATDDEGHDADHESIRTSIGPQRPISSMSGASVESEVIRAPSPVYTSKSIDAALPEEELAAKPELKEMSVQTDEWLPPPRPTVPPSPAFRIGSTGQQFQFVPASSTPTRTTSVASSGGLLPSVMRDSPIARSRGLPSDRRQSMDSIVSSFMDDHTPLPVDKTKPPTMMLPPPPKMPPPSSMPPPAFIPERRSHDVPPPRPSSPPPPELIQRATTPTFGAVLNVPGSRGLGPRQPGSSMPPSQQGLREHPSTHSFRSANNAAALAGSSTPTGIFGKERDRHEVSTTSLNSERSVASPRSSFSSEQHYRLNNLPKPPSTPDRANQTALGPRGAGMSTDPTLIHAITQTMIGEFLYKYTRRAVGGNSRHKRFFWVHPYTKTLYWSDSDPGSSKVTESSAKSAYIEGVRSVLDPNPMPPGLHQYSLVVSTPQRDMKFTAPSKERHDIWMNALRYLLSRANTAGMASPANTTIVPRSPQSFGRDFDDEFPRQRMDSSPQSQRSGRSYRNVDHHNTTPRGTTRSRSQLSMGKRSGTPAMEYLRWNGESPSKSFDYIQPGPNDEELDFELHGEDAEDGFEGLDNVRACCDGRHTVGGHHHHQHPVAGDAPHHEPPRPQFNENSRPVSPSAWSFRSRAGSAHSRETAGMFSWGRAEGKLRFGSKRSHKTIPIDDRD